VGIVKGARLAAAVTFGYLVGTAPSADLACRLATGGTADLRAVGSRNPGANNVSKHLGKGWGYGVMAADIAKGALACVAGRVTAGTNGSHVAGVGAVVGHCYPVWSGFRGGKGVAVSVGQCAATFPVWSVADLLVAWAAAELPRRRQLARGGTWYGTVHDARWWRRRHVGATVVSSSVWVAASALWWRRGWPNLWGPRPSAALPLAAAATSAVILFRLATEPPPLDPGPADEPPPPPDGGDREPLVPVPSLPTLEAEVSLA
jgi:glycerol-3-phosphate acyltransferase PlsY